MDGLINRYQIPVGMRPGRRELNEASVEIANTVAVPAAMRPGIREVKSLWVPKEQRKKRLATMLMNLICQEADANGITLILTAREYDDDSLTEEQLVKWYERFGFQVLQLDVTGTVMARKVHVPEKPNIVLPAAISRSLRTQ